VKDLSGQIFGRLKILCLSNKRGKDGGLYWSCICECGILKDISSRTLISGNVKSCGCYRIETSRQRAIENGHVKTKKSINKTELYEDGKFQCRLCKQILVIDFSVKNRNQKYGFDNVCKPCYNDSSPKSNGIHKNRKYDYEISSWRAQASAVKANAKRRNILWDLTVPQTIVLLQNNCAYCGRPPQSKFPINNWRKYSWVKFENASFLYRNGIDRKNNKLGYIHNNVITCCWICNRAKGDLSYEEFMEWIKQLIKHNSMP